MEAMFDFLGDIEAGTRTNFDILPITEELALPADDILHLVFVVRLLRVFRMGHTWDQTQAAEPQPPLMCE